MVGGMTPWWTDSTLNTASTAPAAPSRWPMLPLLLVTRAPGPPSLVPALAQLQADTSAPGGGRGRTEILAPAVVKMTEGGTVTLECVVTEHAAAPQQFVW